MKKLILIMMTALLIAECSALPFTIEIGESETIDGAWSINIVPAEETSSSSVTSDGIWSNNSNTVFINDTYPQSANISNIYTTGVDMNSSYGFTFPSISGSGWLWNHAESLDTGCYWNSVQGSYEFKYYGENEIVFNMQEGIIQAQEIEISNVSTESRIAGNLTVNTLRVNNIMGATGDNIAINITNIQMQGGNLTMENSSIDFNRMTLGTQTNYSIGFPYIESGIPGWEYSWCLGEKGFLKDTNPVMCFREDSGDIILYPKTNSNIILNAVLIHSDNTVSGVRNLSLGQSGAIQYSLTLGEDWWLQLPNAAPDSGLLFDAINTQWSWAALSRKIFNITVDLSSAGNEALEFINGRASGTVTAEGGFGITYDLINPSLRSVFNVNTAPGGSANGIKFNESDQTLHLYSNGLNNLIVTRTGINTTEICLDGNCISAWTSGGTSTQWLNDTDGNIYSNTTGGYSGNVLISGGLNATAGKHWVLPKDTILWLGEDKQAFLYRSSDNSLQFGNSAGLFVVNAETLVNANLLIKDGQTIKTNLIESQTETSVKITDNLSVTGNITGNMIYGEIYNKSDTGFCIVDLTAQDVYHNITNLTGGLLNGFTNNTNNLTTLIAGTYKVDGHVSMSAGGSGEFGLKLFIGNVGKDNCYSHHHIATGDAVTMAVNCLVKLNAGDEISLQVDDHINPPNDPTIKSVNLNAWRIGN